MKNEYVSLMKVIKKFELTSNFRTQIYALSKRERGHKNGLYKMIHNKKDKIWKNDNEKTRQATNYVC